MQNTPPQLLDTAAPLEHALRFATEEASSALKVWTDRRVWLTLDDVQQVAVERANECIGFGGKVQVMVVHQLGSDGSGSFMLCFDDPDGHTVARTILPSVGASVSEWGELEQSVLTETSNIVTCAYLNALTEMTSIELIPSPPYFLRDYGDSVVDQLVTPHAVVSDTILICQVGFHHEGGKLNASLLFLPSEALEKSLAAAVE